MIFNMTKKTSLPKGSAGEQIKFKITPWHVAVIVLAMVAAYYFAKYEELYKELNSYKEALTAVKTTYESARGACPSLPPMSPFNTGP